MSRNGSGVYTKTNTFSSNTPITALGHNQNFDDIASELTNSVAADGQTTMTGPLKASAGTAALPAYTFGSDPNTGAYRIGADNYGIAVGGAKVVDVAATGMTVTGDVAATGVLKQKGFAILPVGLGPLPWSGSSAPDGWVLTGQTLLRADFPDLWDFAEAEIALGNSLYGVGDGSTTFTIASMGGRVPAGKESSATRLTSTYFGGDSTVLGAVGGLESAPLSLAQLPTGITSSGTNSITVTGFTNGNFFSTNLAGTGVAYQSGSSNFNLSTNAGTASGSNSIAVTSNNTSGNSHKNVQPTIITNYIIFAGV